ncbi:hypothetical protein BO72DRAFT_504582 [Aspergillus fijiensis CBS 313.89]|uniref:Uncharacterized protein n=1 Tax=Aspergillus fijiensis CBS 313.89 TaxID=1448319 RepID=A0A8G1VVK7_9EURO|nr:uncharacterized protein BO72DRAFT_504582 [Aspergillus fijiensis CBS 313.89]RAK71074.1 hypothetical protein BO72DRAFT_504582 [Aspergillus fijiensis CBS 313.89]
MVSSTDDAGTYDHRVWKIGLPVRSAVLKPHAGRLVVGWVTTSESLLLYVFGMFLVFLFKNTPTPAITTIYFRDRSFWPFVTVACKPCVHAHNLRVSRLSHSCQSSVIFGWRLIEHSFPVTEVQFRLQSIHRQISLRCIEQRQSHDDIILLS